jgi:hypothetical protein
MYMPRKSTLRRKLTVEDGARPHVVREPLDEAYLAMASDEEREAEATVWSEGLIGDVADDPR